MNIKNKVKQKPIDSTGCLEFYHPSLRKELTNPLSDIKYRFCDYTSIINYHLHDLEMTWGSIWLWDNPHKEYVPVFLHHVWNIDENDNVYDDFESLKNIVDWFNETKGTKFKINVEEDDYRFLDGSNIKLSKNFFNDDLRIGKMLKRMFHKPLKTPKMIFLSEVGWRPNHTPYNWDLMEKRWSKMESGDIVDYIQN